MCRPRDLMDSFLSSLLCRSGCAVALTACVLAGNPAAAQETETQDAELRKIALTNLPKNAARRTFGAVALAAAGDARSVGEYWKGCYSGGKQMPATGKYWQVMRLYRNRNWGTPMLVEFLEEFAEDAAEVTGWAGILIGDMSQPRGGPMLTGHSSHQLGIEADIWLRPMPQDRFSAADNGTVRSTDLLRADRRDVDPQIYGRPHFELLRLAAKQKEVARVFVNAGIKKALCRDAGKDRDWLRKIRPAAGHSYHFHIRLACPDGQKDCIEQTPPGPGDGCGKELDYWFSDAILKAKPPKVSTRAISMDSMPQACREIVSAPAAVTQTAQSAQTAEGKSKAPEASAKRSK